MSNRVSTLDVREVDVSRDYDGDVLVLTVQDHFGREVKRLATARLDRWQAKELYRSIGQLFDFFDGPSV